VWHTVNRQPNMMEKYMYLSGLQDRNETLFFRVLIDHLESLAPVVYTPTVGEVCKRFGSYFQRPRGMYFSSADRGLFSSMVWNWPHDEVEVVVVTDGSRILGLGDLGANGMGIPIGKLALYVAAGGIHPKKVLPVMLDAGTDNAQLRSDPWYLGMTHPRLKGDEYFSLVHELVRSLSSRWPEAVIQFEDFSSDKAMDILETYRYDTLCFNDDISGTGSVCLASVLSAIRIQGPSARLRDQRIVVVGAGSAGLGVAQALYEAMLVEGATPDEARDRFWVIDQYGLLGPTRPRDTLTEEQAFFARPYGAAMTTGGGRGRGRHGGGGGGSGSSSYLQSVPPHSSGADGSGGFFEVSHVESASSSSNSNAAAVAGSPAPGSSGGPTTDLHAPDGGVLQHDWVPGTGLADKATLLETVSSARPTVILGLTGRGGTFTEGVIREMARHVSRPVIFPLSNPTSNAECTAEQALTWTDGRGLVATGSPSPPVTINGSTFKVSQTNNMYIFPGVGLGASVVKARRITDRMFYAAARALADMVTEDQLAEGMVLPPIADIRRVSARVAAAVASSGIADGIVRKMPPAGDLAEYMRSQMFEPQYRPVVDAPVNHN
jgi:malic enzyme